MLLRAAWLCCQQDRSKAPTVKHQEQRHRQAEQDGEDAASLFIKHRIARKGEPEVGQYLGTTAALCA